MIHAHVTSWFLAIVLFLVAWFLLKKGKARPLKMVQMTLRLFYLFTIGTGAYLLINYYRFYETASSTALFKGLLGLWVIVSMEMVLVRGQKGKGTTAFWLQFLISVLLAIFWGFVVLTAY